MIFRDTGCGVSEENQKKLFHNFGKLQETDSRGVGLGLSICKEIIIASGGSIDIESENDKGTDFIISFNTSCLLEDSRYR